MICGYAKREVGGVDPSLETFGDFRLKLIGGEARATGFVARQVPDGDTETLEVYAGEGIRGAGEEAPAFARLSVRLRSCGLGTLSYEADSEDERAALGAELESWASAGNAVELRGEGFARELSEEERREIWALRASAAKGVRS